MRQFVSMLLLFLITIPSLIYYYTKATDKDLAGVLLIIFGGFFVDRLIDALDRRELIKKVDKTTETIESIIGRVISEAGVTALWRVPLSSAFPYVESRLKGAQKVLNTAWSTHGHGKAVSKSYNYWIKAIAASIIKDGCVVREVVASKERARVIIDLLAKQRKRLTGNYFVTDISNLFNKNPQLPFTEFVVFEHPDRKEVVFGWSTSSDFAANNDCFATAYPPVVAYFEAQFERLSLLGKRHEGKSMVS